MHEARTSDESSGRVWAEVSRARGRSRLARDGATATRRRVRRSARAVEDGTEEGGLCCTACGQHITHAAQACSVAGAHDHRFTNPHGIGYRVSCFATAPGVRTVGPETDEHTWFPGYRWTVAVCAGCGGHLGWRFRSSEAGFYGLITPRLGPCGDGP